MHRFLKSDVGWKRSLPFSMHQAGLDPLQTVAALPSLGWKSVSGHPLAQLPKIENTDCSVFFLLDCGHRPHLIPSSGRSEAFEGFTSWQGWGF